MTYPVEVLEKTVNVIEQFLKTALSDAKAEVRVVARHSFVRYKDLYPNRAKNIFQYLDYSV